MNVGTPLNTRGTTRFILRFYTLLPLATPLILLVHLIKGTFSLSPSITYFKESSDNVKEKNAKIIKFFSF